MEGALHLQVKVMEVLVVCVNEGRGGLLLWPPRAVPAIFIYGNLSHGLEEA
jgi:hypothetical protein